MHACKVKECGGYLADAKATVAASRSLDILFADGKTKYSAYFYFLSLRPSYSCANEGSMRYDESRVMRESLCVKTT